MRMSIYGIHAACGPQWKVAPALAAGNTIVLKPSEMASLTCLELAAIAHEVSLPPGVLNVITGTGADAGSPLRCVSCVVAWTATAPDAFVHLVTRRGSLHSCIPATTHCPFQQRQQHITLRTSPPRPHDPHMQHFMTFAFDVPPNDRSSHPDVAKIAFTGSVATGKRVAMAAAGILRPATMELGGKSALLVFEDAEIEKAVEWAMVSERGGRRCRAGHVAGWAVQPGCKQVACTSIYIPDAYRSHTVLGIKHDALVVLCIHSGDLQFVVH